MSTSSNPFLYFPHDPWGSWVSAMLPMALVFLVATGLAILFYRRYLNVSAGRALLLWLGVVLLMGMFWQSAPMNGWRFGFPAYGQFHVVEPVGLWPRRVRLPPELAFIPMLVLLGFGAGFLAKLYDKWVHDRVTEAERRPGMEGVRAWLGGGNLLVALVISLGATFLGFSFISVFLLALLALLAYPVLGTVFQSPALPEMENQDLSAEREKVLKLLENGKVSAEEAGELLNALSQTLRPAEGLSWFRAPWRKALLFGLGLTAAGFVLDGRLAGHWLGVPVLLLAFSGGIALFDRTTQWSVGCSAVLLTLGLVFLVVLWSQTGPLTGGALALVGYGLLIAGMLREAATLRQARQLPARAEQATE